MLAELGASDDACGLRLNVDERDLPASRLEIRARRRDNLDSELKAHGGPAEKWPNPGKLPTLATEWGCDDTPTHR
jgi:hypothetical protein